MLNRVICSTLVYAAALLVPSVASASGFKLKALLPADPNPQSVALGDFNCDGKLDLAVASYESDDAISVRLGNGDGTFYAAVRYSVGYAPWGVSVADVNMDGYPDLLVSNLGDDTISVLLGNGDGTFQPQLVFFAGDGPAETAVGDVNHDGFLDLATASIGPTILLGNGDGTFQPPLEVGPRLAAFCVILADFNRDGTLDLALGQPAGTTGRVEILLGLGDGTFQSFGTYDLTRYPYSFALGDLNHDQKLDLVAGTYGLRLAVLLGNGDGTFHQAVYYDNPIRAPYGIVMADFNRDGNPDVATALDTDPSSVSVFNGNGDGTLQPAVSYDAGGNEGAGMATGDLNGDGSLDLVMANLGGLHFGSYAISILLNTGGTFLKTTSSLNPSHHGESVTFTTKVKESVPGTGVPTGTVTFKDGNTALKTVPLVSGAARFTTSRLSVGTHKIVACYSGDTNFNRNEAEAQVQVVNP